MNVKRLASFATWSVGDVGAADGGRGLRSRATPVAAGRKDDGDGKHAGHDNEAVRKGSHDH